MVLKWSLVVLHIELIKNKIILLAYVKRLISVPNLYLYEIKFWIMNAADCECFNQLTGMCNSKRWSYEEYFLYFKEIV